MTHALDGDGFVFGQNSYTSRIIASVLQRLESVHDAPNRRFIAHIANNATHTYSYQLVMSLMHQLCRPLIVGNLAIISRPFFESGPNRSPEHRILYHQMNILPVKTTEELFLK